MGPRWAVDSVLTGKARRLTLGAFLAVTTWLSLYSCFFRASATSETIQCTILYHIIRQQLHDVMVISSSISTQSARSLRLVRVPKCAKATIQAENIVTYEKQIVWITQIWKDSCLLQHVIQRTRFYKLKSFESHCESWCFVRHIGERQVTDDINNVTVRDKI